MSAADTPPTQTPLDLVELANALQDIVHSSQYLSARLIEQGLDSNKPIMRDDLGVMDAFVSLFNALMRDPALLAEHQTRLWSASMALAQWSALRLMGGQPDPVITPDPGDRRFKDDAWHQDWYFDWLKQGYLLYSHWLEDLVKEADDLDPQTAQKLNFYTRQIIDAAAPTNFISTNPEALREVVRTNGQSFVNGLRNFLRDMERGKGKLSIRMTDLEAFQLGENIAATPGAVVFENRMMQLLQYTPTTEQVYKRPLLIVPPWINKYYILDLRPKNSFIKWAVDQGFTVFVISWVNPDESYAEAGFEEYLNEGVLAALDAIQQATGETEVHAAGYCLGGTLLAATLGYLAQVGREPIKSATFFTTLIDFSQPGELSVFLDENQVARLEKRMDQRGFLDGADMATTFTMLRANDLIWSFFINNYLLGKDPFPFDLLYWNSDSTRMPAKMHSFYLRRMYLENRLVEVGGIQLLGHPIDLRKVNTPAYFISTKEDHIAPWKATYRGPSLLSGPVRFVLGGSGHIAGVINPPVANKYGFWVREDELPTDPDQWLKGAEQRPGSWWTDWFGWATQLNDEQVPARTPGSGALKVIEPAPGRYVKQRL